MKILIIVLAHLFVRTLTGQTRKFDLYTITDSKSEISIDNFLINKTFEFDGYSFIIGEYPPYTPKNYGLRFVVFDKKKNKIFESKGGTDEYYMHPYFFKTCNVADGLLVSLATGFEDCGFSTIYLIKDNEIKSLGYLNICALIDGDRLNIEKYVSITTSKNEYYFSFEDEKVPGFNDNLYELKIVYYDQDGQEQVVNGNRLKYKYSEGILKRFVN